MGPRQVVSLLAIALCRLLIFSRVAAAQTDDELQLGLQPFGMYSGGNFDSISLTTQKLNVHIPLLSYPQRGGKLHLNFWIDYDSPTFTRDCGLYGDCQWDETAGGDLGVTTDIGAGLFGQDIVDQYDHYKGTDYRVTEPNGVVHLMGAIPTASGPTRELRALDASGYYGVPNWSDHTQDKLYDADGTLYYQSGNNFVAQDTNGNTITGVWTESGGVISDTLLRSISPIPRKPQSGSGDGDFRFCSTGATSEKNWNVPDINGQQATFQFCWNVWGQLINVVLPNTTKYTFQYQSLSYQDYGGWPVYGSELTEVDLPTGGKISYASDFRAVGCATHAAIRAIQTRTEKNYDGGQSHQWSYSWNSSQKQLTVTDPQNNSAVYTAVSLAPPSCALYVQTALQRDSGGASIRTLTTARSYTADPGPRKAGALSVVPTSVTQAWSQAQGNQQSRRATSYGTQFTFVDYAQKTNGTLGARATAYFTANPASVTESDYGTGAPGATLRQTLFNYAAFPNWVCTGVYCQANLLNLAASTNVTGAAGDNNQGLTGYGYDGLGNLLELDRYLWAGGQWRALPYKFDYTSHGMLQDGYAPSDPTHHRTIYSYDATGLFLSSVTDALWHTTQYSYDASTGALKSVTDPNSRTTSFSYDPMRRPVSASFPDGGSTTWQYNQGVPTSVTVTEKITSTINKTQIAVLDGFGRVTQTKLNSDPEGVDYVDSTYDGLGRLWTVKNPHRDRSSPTDGTTTYAYDALGRALTQTQPDGGTITQSYTGNVTTVTDEAGKVRKTRSDPMGRLTAVWEDPDSLNYETDYTYDCLDDLVKVTQKGSSGDPSQYRVRSFSYDTLGRLLSATTPESGLTSYVYDDNNTLVTRKDARNITTTYSSDALYRTTQRQYSNGDPTVKYCYDNYQAPCGVGGAVQNGIGRRTAMADGSGSASWSYDVMGRLGQEVKTIRGVTATTAYLYNLDGSLNELGYPYGDGDQQPTFKVDYGYSPAGRPVWAKLLWYGSVLADFAENATYTPGGALTSVRNPASGATITNSYDKRLQPAFLSATAPLGNIFHLDYDFKLGSADNGNVYGMANPLNTDRSQVFTYDRLNRLLTAATSGCGHANSWGDSYVIDAWGNLTQKNISPCTNGEYWQVTADVHNRLQAGNYIYDAAGNLTGAGSIYNTFNAEGEWTYASVTGSSYLYDGDGQKVQRTGGPSGTFWYFTDQTGRVLEETNRAGWGVHKEDEFFYFGGIRMGYAANFDILGGGALYYTYGDHLGTPRLITNSSGTPCYSADYWPWGWEQYVFANNCADKQDYKFTGQEQDPDTNSHYFGARWLRDTMARFYSPDPAGIAAADLSNPQTLNLYSYVQNSPLSFTDPTGLGPDWESEFGADHSNINIGGEFDFNKWYGNGMNSSHIAENELRYLQSVPFYTVAGDNLFLKIKTTSALDAERGLPDTFKLFDLGSLSAYDKQLMDLCGQKGVICPSSGIPKATNWLGTNYCGPGGSGAELNPADGKCHNHDDDYDNFGLKIRDNFDWGVRKDKTKQMNLWKANQRLCNDALKSGGWRGPIIAAVFSVAPALSGANCSW